MSLFYILIFSMFYFCVTPTIKTSPFIDRRLCHVINNEINQMLFTSCTSTYHSTIRKSSSFTRTNRRYQSMREGKEQRRQKHSQKSGSFDNDHQTGGEADLTLTSTHIYEEINDVVEGCDSNDQSINYLNQRTDFTSTEVSSTILSYNIIFSMSLFYILIFSMFYYVYIFVP